MAKVIWTLIKILILATIVAYGIWFGYRNIYVLEAFVEFQVPVPFGADVRLPAVSIWAVFGGLFFAGILLGGFAGVGASLKHKRAAWKATRRIRELEGEVVSYRGNAARESERREYGDPND